MQSDADTPAVNRSSGVTSKLKVAGVRCEARCTLRTHKDRTPASKNFRNSGNLSSRICASVPQMASIKVVEIYTPPKPK